MADACDAFRNEILAGILRYDGIFRGLTYGDYLREWCNWIHSDTPSYRGYRGEICYLQGNLSYYYDKDTGIRVQAEKFQNNGRDMDGNFRGLVVWTSTAVFVPVMAAFYSVSETDPYDGGELQSLADCQFACRRDIYEGGERWCTLEKKGLDCDPIDLNANVLYYESPSFKLTVSEKSLLAPRFEVPIHPNTYDTFTAVLAVMLNTSNTHFLSEGEYRLRYGGFGRGLYKNDAIQDFNVRPDLGWPKISPPGAHLPPDHSAEVPPL